MNEREVFLAAVEIPDLDARRAYLDQACAGDPGLRAQVEALLNSHANANEFMTSPAVEQMGFDPVATGTSSLGLG